MTSLGHNELNDVLVHNNNFPFWLRRLPYLVNMTAPYVAKVSVETTIVV